MTAVWNMLMVARYERKMLLRTTRFRILGGVGIAIPIVLSGVLAVAEARGVEFGSTIGLAAYVPFYVYSYLQTVVIAFIVGDFRAADERAGVYEVVSGRPISTAELVLGKYFGVVGALFTLSLGVLGMTLAVQAAKISITGAPFSLRPYLAYLVLMNLPGLIYMSAVTFFLGALWRRQTAVALVTIAYALAVLFFLGRRYDGIYDFGAFFAPLFYSDLIGLGDVDRVVDQRLFYLSLGVFFLGLSVDRYPRLSQSSGWTWFGRSMALAGVVCAAGLYFLMEQEKAGAEAYRRSLFEVQAEHARIPAPEATHYDLRVDFLDRGVPLQGQARIRLKNPHDAALDTLIFTLNPGLRVVSVHGAAGWDRKGSVVRVVPEASLLPGAETEVTLVYAGDIDRNGFDLLREEALARLHKQQGPISNKGDMTAWILSTSAFLPPRCGWYPVPGVDYGHPGERPVSFATANLSVSTPVGLTAVTQGVPGEPVREGRRRERTTWTVEKPVPQFSLNVGKYEVFSATIHGIQCAFYVHPVHRRQAEFFEEAKEEALEALDQLLDAVEQETGLSYPYSRLSLVEVPFQVQWYYEGWEESGGLTQPGVLMIEEDVLMGLRLSLQFDRRIQRARGDVDRVQIKRDLLVNSVFRTFLSKEDARNGLFRSPVLQLWAFDKAFRGEHYGLVKRGLPLFMQEDLQANLQQALYSRGRRGRFFRGRMRSRPGAAGTERDTIIARMQQRSFADVDPVSEPGLYRAVLEAKGPPLFKMVEAVLGEEEFRTTLADFEANHQYGDASFASFERAAVGDTTGSASRANLQRLLHEWIYGTHVPGYTLTSVKGYKVDDGFGMVVYQVLVRIRNGEPGRGFVQVQVSGQQDEVIKGVEIEGGQEVEVAMILWDRPFRVAVEPFFARNRNPLVSTIRIPDQPVETNAQSYVREIPPGETVFSELIVDDEDDGFSMPIRRVQRYLRPELKGDNWREENRLPFAFGRYEPGYRWKPPGDGAQPAVWTARLPYKGYYDVAYYFTSPRFWERRRGASTFNLIVFHSGGADTLTMKTGELRQGWNLLGRFWFEADSEAKVELPDRADGRLYADAVRWRTVNFGENEPEEESEPEMPFFGGRPPGEGRGERGGRSGGAGGRDGGPGGRGGGFWE